MWLKRSLFAKLLLGMLVASVIPFSLSNIVSYQTTSQGIEQNSIQLNQKTMSLGMDNVKQYLQELTLDSVAYYQDDALMSNLRRTEASSSLLIQIREQLNKLYGNRPEMRAVMYKNVRINQTFTLHDKVELGTEINFPDIAVPKLKGQWDERKEFEVSTIGKEKVLALHRLLVDYPDSTVLGLTSLYVGLDKISSMMDPLSDISKGEVTFLYLQDGQTLLYTSGKGNSLLHIDQASFTDAQGSLAGEFNGREGIFIFHKNQYKEMPLTIVKFVPREAINESANQMLNRVLIIQVLAIAFVIVLASLLSYITISPIKRLLQMIGQVESGNFKMKPTNNQADELGILEQRFQTMIHNLDELVIREYRSQLEISTARLKMLQAQINPHFLYNTLQSIGTLALRNGVEEISDKITELGSILRYSMDIETEHVPLLKEIRHVEDYLSLQKGRFKHKLSYTLSCPEEALQVLVPKMVLQPLVENSIVHGIEKGNGTGTLHIGIEMTGEKLNIRVIDNGKGIDMPTIQQIKKEYASFQQYRKEGGIGLMNVLYRLQLYYAAGFEWDIESIPYTSTVISLGITTEIVQGGNGNESIDRG
ncbi:sensor histidine kinase [Paenibacillus agricola]|uniref:Histidine kinase n=1 Tax=Paenibacillus agricola TaxID=2716264 RepID=A0ABX0JFT9_9BACL|nr:histidine kinase [Paenibacillus agricola]NHN34641.1 histidine kinase [Paenibacillus agricola]